MSISRISGVLAVLVALGSASACERHDIRPMEAHRSGAPRTVDASANRRQAPTAEPSVAHGLWVWRTQYHLDQEGALLATCKAASVTEVYLAVTAGLLGDPRLPPLVLSLRRAGLRVEALLGEASWYDISGRPRMLRMLDAVAAYDDRVSTASRFQAVHLDIEPHQLPENKGRREWLPTLAETLQIARERTVRSDLSLSADVPRFAITDASEETRAAFAAAVPRLFLMLYELRDRRPEAEVNAAAETAQRAYAHAAGTMVIGVSVEDFAELGPVLGALDAARPGGLHYGGWAIHDERRLAERLR
jgi:hypothetical protein